MKFGVKFGDEIWMNVLDYILILLNKVKRGDPYL